MVEIGAGPHSVVSFGNPAAMTFREATAQIAACDYEHLMVLGSEKGPPLDKAGDAPAAFVNLMESDPAALLKSVSGFGLRVSCVYPGCPLDYSAEGVKPTVERLLRYRETIRALGCHVMCLSVSGARRPGMPFEEKREAVARVAEVIDAVASDEPGDLFKVGIDIHYGAIVETVADCEYLLERCGNTNAGLCLNMGHLSSAKQDGWTLLEKYPGRVHIVAWKDHKVPEDGSRPWVSVRLGDGLTQLEKYVAAWKSSGCLGVHLITVEHEPPERKAAALRESLQYLRGMGV